MRGTYTEIGAATGLYLMAGASGQLIIPCVAMIGHSASLVSSLNANAVITAGFDTKLHT